MKNTLIFILILFHMTVVHGASCVNKIIWGKIEKATLVDKNIILDAKLDTGASMSSLSATEMTLLTEGQTQWVKFSLLLPHQKKITFREPLVRMIHIRKRAEEKDNVYSNTRPVIILKIKIGNKTQAMFVNLIDRREFQYPLLIGSDALKKYDVLIDVKHNYFANKR